MNAKDIEETSRLLAATAKGDHLAFRRLFDCYQKRVYSYALTYLKSSALAEEIVQDVFLNLWTGREKLVKIANFGGYLRKVTVNRVLDEIRSINSKRNALLKSMQNWDESDLSTERIIQQKDSDAYIDLLLSRLPKQQRLVYTLCTIQGLKQREVAEQLNISPLTVKVHLREAVKNLRLLLGEHPTLSLGLIFVGVSFI